MSGRKERRILLVSLGRQGGMPKYAQAIAAAFESLRMPFESICSSGSEHPIPGAWRIPTYRGVPTLLLSSLTVLPLLLVLLTWRRLAGGFQVMYFPYIHTWTPVLVMWGRLLSCRTVVTFHDYRPHFGEANVATRLILWLTSRLASHFIFLSSHVREEAVADQPAIGAHSMVSPHGLFSLPGLHQKSPDELAETVGTLLFLGRISKYKGVEMLAQAFGDAALPDCRLVIAGRANYEMNAAMFPEGVRLIDRFLDEEEMAALVNAADVIVLPYLEATQSGIVTLAIDAAIPIVCTRVPGLREQLSEEEAVFCDPDVQSLSQAIRQVASLPARRHLCEALSARKRTMDWKAIAVEIHEHCVGRMG